jgi:hypothetical protein
MSVRLLPALAVAAAALAAPAAHAKAPLCKQITDPAGDAYVSANPAKQPSYDALDVVSADVATGRHNLVAVLRLKTLKPDQTLLTGATYSLDWRMAGVTQELTYYTYAASTEHDFFFDPGGSGLNRHSVDGVVDTKAATITWIVPRKDVPTLKKKKAAFTSLVAHTAYAVNDRPPLLLGPQRFGTAVDSATAPKPYVDLTPTCVKGV